MVEKKYCIMDMDGTLIDSMPYWDRLSPDYLEARGIPGPFDRLMERIKTMTMPEACEVLRQTFHLTETAQEITRELGDIMRQHYAADIPLKKGVPEYLDALRTAGAKVCIVTATNPELVRLCLERLGIWQDFDFVLSCEEVGRGKDEPDAFLEAARRMGAAPEETAVFEDAFTALRTAKNAGFHTVAVKDPFSARWEESRAIADEVIEDWESALP